MLMCSCYRSHIKAKEMLVKECAVIQVLLKGTLLLSSHIVFYLQYEGSIEENTKGVEVMRIKAEDLDLEGTDNWEAVFDIVKGNEGGYFSIKTDPITNEGILMLDKVLQF